MPPVRTPSEGSSDIVLGEALKHTIDMTAHLHEGVVQVCLVACGGIQLFLDNWNKRDIVRGSLGKSAGLRSNCLSTAFIANLTAAASLSSWMDVNTLTDTQHDIAD